MSEIVKKVVAEEIKLQSVRVINGSIKSSDELDPSLIDGFHTHFEFAQGVDIENNAIRLIIGVKLDGFSKEGKELGVNAEYQTEFIFYVENLKGQIIQGVNEKVNEVQINSSLSAVLGGIAYSTLRGIVLTRTQGTVIDGVILPVIDPNKLIKGEYTRKQ